MSDEGNTPTVLAEPPEKPRVLAGRYELLEQIGRGGMGTVWRARHILMGKEFALKILLPEMGANEEFVRRFEREARAASLLDHPHCIAVTDFGRDEPAGLFLVMELLRGKSLAYVLETEGRVAPERALVIVRQILQALAHAHAKGIVHRDLKPENVFLLEREDGADHVKLLDFGIAKMAAPDAKGETLTRTGLIFGTPSYLSPEQAAGEQADYRSDLYAVGVMLFEMVAGRRPFVSESMVEVISMHLTRPPPSLRATAKDIEVSELLEAAVARALCKRRDERFSDANAFLRALEVGATPMKAPAVTHEVSIPWRYFSAFAAVAALAGLAIYAAREYRPREPIPLGRSPGSERGRVSNLEACAAIRDLYAARKHDAALAAHRQMLRDCSRDPVLLAAAASMVEDRRLGDDALALLAEIGRPAAEALGQVAVGRNLSRRQRAIELLRKIGAEDRYDRAQALVLDLEQLPTCGKRRVVLKELAATKDPRAIPAIRKAAQRKGGFLGLFAQNECLEKDARAALKELEAKR